MQRRDLLLEVVLDNQLGPDTLEQFILRDELARSFYHYHQHVKCPRIYGRGCTAHEQTPLIGLQLKAPKPVKAASRLVGHMQRTTVARVREVYLLVGSVRFQNLSGRIQPT